MAFFRRKTKEAEAPDINYVDSMIMEQFTDASQEYLLKMADHLMLHKPLVGSIDALDIDDANKTIAFLTGVIYALGGRVLRINSHSFMFATEAAYQDQGIKRFLSEIL